MVLTIVFVYYRAQNMLTFAVSNALFNRNGFFEIFSDMCNNTFAIVNLKMVCACATIFCNLIVILHLLDLNEILFYVVTHQCNIFNTMNLIQSLWHDRPKTPKIMPWEDLNKYIL